MKKRAIIFPCDQEALSMIRNIDMCVYDIKYIATLKGFDLSYDKIEGANVGEYTSNKLMDIDSMIIMETSTLISFDDVVYPKILEAVKLGKDIVIARELEDKVLEKCEKSCKEYGVKLEILLDNTDSSMLESVREESVEVPVIFVAGVSINTEKFDVQMAIRKKFIEAGYKVSQIGSRKNCELVGFHSFPKFMREEIDAAKKIILFKKYVKYIENSENPDVIIIGIPGGIMPLTNKHHFDFGLTAFMIANAVHPDYVVMNLFYSLSYTKEQLDEFSKVCNGRLSFEIDSFHISSVFVEPSSLNDFSLKYMGIDNKGYNHDEENLWNLVAEEDAEKVFIHIIERLSAYNINQI